MFVVSPYGPAVTTWLGLDMDGHPALSFAGLTAFLMAGTGIMLAAGMVPFGITGLGLEAARAAVRRRPVPATRSVWTFSGSLALLAAWVALYGAAPFWVAWDAVILAGAVGSAWNLAVRPGRENHHV